jgi:hypothetical protein
LDASARLWLREYLLPLLHRLRLLRGPPQLIPANRPGLAVARWRVKSRTDELRMEIFQEALVESGLLEAIVLSILLIRSGRSLGDSPGLIDLSDPRFFSRFHPRLI